MSQNRTEKILQNYSVGLKDGQKVHSGDTLWLEPHHVLSHDNTSAILPKFEQLKKRQIFDSKQPVIALDHNIQDKSPENVRKYSTIKNFANYQGLNFFEAGKGIGHQLMVEQGFAFPETFCVGADSHSNMYGGIGCLGTPVVRSDVAILWSIGKIWWSVPPVVRIIFNNKAKHGITGKDIILNLIASVGRKAVLNKALEFDGDGISSLDIDDRLTIANMTTEWGALTGLFPVDEKTLDWLLYKQKNNPNNLRFNKEKIHKIESEKFESDNNAIYEKTISVDLSTISKAITMPNDLEELLRDSDENIKINKAYIVSCVNSRKTDLLKAAEILKNNKVSPDVELYVSPASAEIESELKKTGHWEIFLKSGAIILPPGCGPCIGLGKGILEEGDVAISSTNRNFPGRMGDKNSRVYLSSPELVASSAIKGFIDSSNYKDPKIEIISHSNNRNDSHVEAIKMDMELIEGPVLLCPNDNISTDGIFPSSHTYNESLTDEEIANLAMLNYDPDFQHKVQSGDILVSGFNFGCGSSREQAAVSLSLKGIKIIVAGSFSQTFRRNAINNGFGLVEAPEFYEFIINNISTDGEPTVRTLIDLRLDFSNQEISSNFLGKKFSFQNWSEVETDLIRHGGINKFILAN